MELMSPRATDLVLDVGVTNTDWRSSNFLEASYPWPAQITAVALEPMPTFQKLFPGVHLIVADGRKLPFDDNAFDIGFSNAVVEHAGTAEDQRQFIGELVRTCRRVFVATPNGGFPIDPHTLLPFVHWLPRRVRHPILRATANGMWASETLLRPLNARGFRSLFPPDADVQIVRETVLGVATVLIAITQGPDAVASS